jgi:hypothetical protein
MARAGDKISASDFNAVQSTIATVMGTYYGQTVNSSQVTSAGSKITAAQWQALYTDILTAYNHQNSSNGLLVYPTTNRTIQASDFNAYQTLANNCLSNYLNFNSGYATAVGVNTQTFAGGWGSASNGQQTAIQIFQLVFPSDAAARYFFNTGGQVRFSASLASNGSAKDNSWASLLSHMGTIAFGANSTFTLPGAVSPGTGSSIGFYQQTGGAAASDWTTIFTKYTENPTYSPNQFTLYCFYDKYGAAGGGAAPPYTLHFRAEFEDLSGPNYQGPFNIDEAIGGTTTSSQSLYYASGAGQVDVTNYLPYVRNNVIIYQNSNP